MDQLTVLALNAGSSSLKAAIYSFTGDVPADPITPSWTARTSGKPEFEPLQRSIGPVKIDVVGHRIVHGGSKFRESTFITPEVKAAIVEAGSLAPAHNRIEIQGMEAVERLLGSAIPQVAVFDTAFHSTLPPAAYVYPGPYSWLEEGIRRYGFHGINHQYVAGKAARLLDRDLASLRLITCHLGSGCSLAAIRDGICIDTTMGFTPMEGLMMGTRSGSIDPGIILHLLRHGVSVDRMDEILNRESGLLGISGVSSDMREILAAMKHGDPRAQLAFDIYVHRIRFNIGALLPALGRLDALIFTGGVGENSSAVREAVCRDMDFLGQHQVLVVKAEEEWQIALECLRLHSADAR